MRHITFRPAVAVITFCIGLIAVALWVSQPSAPKRCASDGYFPVGVLSQSTGKVERFGRYYSAMMEAPLSCLDEDIEAYRLLSLISSEPPASVRIWRRGDRKYIEVRQLSSVGMPQYGAKDLKVNVTRLLADNEWNHFQELLEKSNFWAMPTEDGKPVGLDGASFLLEGKKPHRYHVVDRWFPEDQNFLNACGYLYGISGLAMKQ
jgi:hypothetical protein